MLILFCFTQLIRVGFCLNMLLCHLVSTIFVAMVVHIHVDVETFFFF